MYLEKLITISGKPGIFKVISQTKGGFIIEDIITNKRTSISTQNQVSLLENIAVYTYDEEIPLKDLFDKIYEFTNNNQAIHHKESSAKLREFMLQVLPNYDKERVYDSDLKKIIMWYNLLQSQGLISPEKKGEIKEKEEKSEKPKKTSKAKKADETN